MLWILLAANPLLSQVLSEYVEIDLADDRSVELLRNAGELDPCSVRDVSGGLRVIVRSEVLARLSAAGLGYKIVDADPASTMAAHLEAEAKSDHARPASADDPQHFRLGPAGGSYTIEGLFAILDSMALLYPDLVVDSVIGHSHRGIAIRAVRIAAPDGPEDRPRALLTALHHAREPLSMVTLVYSMWYLLENYGSDREITSLLEQRELWFVPMVNPDGYARNLATHPQGGGLWRKNGGEAGVGVDLNRNYGPMSVWDNQAWSPEENPASDNYRGPAPFSEPESRAIRDLADGIGFSAMFHHHSLGNVLIYERTETGFDSSIDWWSHTSWHLGRTTGYPSGSGAMTIGYDAAGTTNGWAGATRNRDGSRRFAWVPEIGSRNLDGLWPARHRYPEWSRSVLPMNLELARVAGSHLVVESIDVDGGVVITLRNVGTDTLRTGSVEMSDNHRQTLADLEPGQTVNVMFAGAEVDSLVDDHRVDLKVRIVSDGVESVTTANFLGLHRRTILFDDRLDNDLDRWQTDSWGIETTSDGLRVASDSPYEPADSRQGVNGLTLRDPVQIPEGASVSLIFETAVDVVSWRWDLHVVVVPESGVLTRIDSDELLGSVSGTVTDRSFLSGQIPWRRFRIPLDDYAGSSVRIGFELRAGPSGSNGMVGDGILLRDVRIESALPKTSSVGDLYDLDPAHCEVLAERIDGMVLTSAQLAGTLSSAGVGSNEIQLVDVLGRDAGSEGDARSLPTGVYHVQFRNRCVARIILVP